MSSLAPKNYLPQLNIIRAVASLAVAVYHLGGKTMPLLNYGWLGVEMFFVLTGFVICWSFPKSYSLSDFPEFLYKRIIRIEPPYVCSILLILLLAFLLNTGLDKIHIANVLLHFAYLNNFFGNDYLSPVYWTLGIEFQFYILIGLLFPFLFRNKYAAVIGLVIINLISFLFPLKYAVVTNYFPYFTVGILIYLHKRGLLKEIVVYLLLVLTIAHLYVHNGAPEAIITLATACIILFIGKSNPLIDFFSKISFSLYLTHDIIGSKIVLFLGSLFVNKNMLTKAFSFSVGLTLTIGFAYLFYLFVEKKFIAISKKIIYQS